MSNVTTRNDVSASLSRESVCTNSPDLADSVHALSSEDVIATDTPTRNTESDAETVVTKLNVTEETFEATPRKWLLDENSTTSNHPTQNINFTEQLIDGNGPEIEHWIKQIFLEM